MTAVLNNQGQVTVPVRIRERQRLRPGNKLTVEEHARGIVLKKARKKRKESLLQWLQDCPVADFKIVRGYD